MTQIKFAESAVTSIKWLIQLMNEVINEFLFNFPFACPFFSLVTSDDVKGN